MGQRAADPVALGRGAHRRSHDPRELPGRLLQRHLDPLVGELYRDHRTRCRRRVHHVELRVRLARRDGNALLQRRVARVSEVPRKSPGPAAILSRRVATRWRFAPVDERRTPRFRRGTPPAALRRRDIDSCTERRCVIRKMIFAAYGNFEDATEAMAALTAAGVPSERVSLVMADSTRHLVPKLPTNAPEGAAVGGALGALAGLLTAVATLAIPGVGVLAAGPIVAAVGGGSLGTLGGGLAGALDQVGIPDAEARRYAQAVMNNGFVLGERPGRRTHGNAREERLRRVARHSEWRTRPEPWSARPPKSSATRSDHDARPEPRGTGKRTNMTTLPSRIALSEGKREAIIQHLNMALAMSVDRGLASEAGALEHQRGLQFFARHALFDKPATRLRDAADSFAERAATLGGYAEGTVRLAAERSRLPEYDMRVRDGRQHIQTLVDRYARYTAFLRDTLEEVKTDLVTQDLRDRDATDGGALPVVPREPRRTGADALVRPPLLPGKLAVERPAIDAEHRAPRASCCRRWPAAPARYAGSRPRRSDGSVPGSSLVGGAGSRPGRYARMVAGEVRHGSAALRATSATARSIAFISSRTLPGKRIRRELWRRPHLPWRKPDLTGARTARSQACACANIRMSSPRARSGGTAI